MSAERLARISRRELIKGTAGIAIGTAGIRTVSRSQGCLAKEGTVRDRLWLFGVPANDGYGYVHRRSLMSPAEGAYYLGIPNILMNQVVRRSLEEEGKYKPFEPPFEQYTIALRPLKRMLWSITGSGGYSPPEYRKEVLSLAKTTPNCVGLYMDDFFFTGKKREAEGRQAALSVDELKEIRQQARGSGKKLDIWVTFYTRLLGLPLDDYLKLIDVITLWTWSSEDLKDLQANLNQTEELAPRLRKTLGCYFFDFTKRQPLSVVDMKYQCEAGLHWLRQGKIEGIMFLSNCMEDLGFESVEWTREWIQKVGDIAL